MPGTMWKPYRIVPDDVLFFRDGKPSSRGDDHFLRSIFPPAPSTLYGALRTRRLMDELDSLDGMNEERWNKLPEDLKSELGEWGGVGSMKMRGPWIVKGDKEILFPAPADLGLVFKELDGAASQWDRIAAVVRYLPAEDNNGAKENQWSHFLNLLTPCVLGERGWSPWSPSPDENEPKPPTGWYLNSNGMNSWLEGRVPAPDDFVHATELWADEVRTGVGLMADRRSHEIGQLYTFGYIRLHADVSIGFELRGAKLEANGGLRLGGDGRTAALADGPSLHVSKISGGCKRLNLYCATPILSESGGLFPGVGSNGVGKVNGVEVKVVAACVREHALIGGWDLAKRRPKTLRRAIPAGAVVIVEALAAGGAFAMDAVESLHEAGVSDYPAEHLVEHGYGFILAGRGTLREAN